MFDKHGVYRVIYYNFLHTLYNNIPFETGMRFQMKDMPIHVGQDKRYTVVADSLEYVVSSVTVSDDGEEEVVVLEEDDTDTPIFYIPDETGLRKIDLRETFKFCLEQKYIRRVSLDVAEKVLVENPEGAIPNWREETGIAEDRSNRQNIKIKGDEEDE